MLVIRMSRVGKKKQPLFRFVVSEKNKDPWGRYLENLGNYNPRTKEIQLDADRIKHWISMGAQPSNTVWNLLVDKGLVEGKKRKSSCISKTRLAKIAEAKKAEAPVPAPAVIPTEEPKA